MISLAERHGLTFHDASWAATAEKLGITLVSADRPLRAAGLADSPTTTAARLRLPTKS
jgi:predicted nucleic acid-binding protein